MDENDGQNKVYGVFISSTRSDLTGVRKRIAEKLMSGPFLPVAAENFVAGPDPAA